MKIVICLAIVCSFVALAFGEPCSDAGDCGHVTCPENDYTLECVTSQCTCTHGAATCNTQSDCTGTDSRCTHDWHCYDNKCRCGFGGFGGGFGHGN